MEDIAEALVSEPYDVGGADWHTDLSGWASVGVFCRGLTLSDVEIGDRYVAVTVSGTVRVHSCYASPALTVDEFEQFLGHLDGSVRKYRGVGVDRLVAGDFNA